MNDEKKFTKPEADLVILENDDIITESFPIDDSQIE